MANVIDQISRESVLMSQLARELDKYSWMKLRANDLLKEGQLPTLTVDWRSGSSLPGHHELAKEVSAVALSMFPVLVQNALERAEQRIARCRQALEHFYATGE